MGGRKQKFVDNSPSIARRLIIKIIILEVCAKQNIMVSVIAVHLCDRTHQELSFKTKPLTTNNDADLIM